MGLGSDGVPGYGGDMTDDQTRAKATRLLELHRAPELLTVVNVWDVISATVVADVPGTRALATASHSIAASYGYADGENIPVELMLETVGRIAAAVDLPVSADLEGGYGDAAETVRRAIGVGIVGANIEDQMKPLAEAAAPGGGDHAGRRRRGRGGLRAQRPHRRVRAGRRPRPGRGAGRRRRARQGVPRGRRAGRVRARPPRRAAGQHAGRRASGPQRLTLIGIPGTPSLARMQELGVARCSFGPMSQNVALTALQELVEEVHRGGGVPRTMRMLN